MRIFPETFKVETVEETKVGREEHGTIEVEINGKTLTVEARRYGRIGGDIYLRGFIGSYRTSAKNWRAVVRVDGNGNIFAHFGRDDRSGRFDKLRGIAYNPEAYANASS